MGVTAAVVAVGATAAGTVVQMDAADRMEDAQKQQVGIEQQQEQVRQKQMEMTARRQQLEIVRQQQRSRALALTNATSQGAQYGSGLQGGYGQISGMTNFNLSGVRQNLGFGEQMFALNQQLGQNKMDQATIQGDAAFGQGLTSLGGAFLKAGPAMGNMFAGAPSQMTYTDYGTNGGYGMRPMYN